LIHFYKRIILMSLKHFSFNGIDQIFL